MNKKKVLIVDDDKAIVEAIQMILDDAGYDVSKLIDIEKIINMKENLPDVILLDYALLGMDGWDICSNLKSQELLKNIPIIMISADKDIANIAEQAKADDYLPKPFEMNDLLQKVQKHI